MAEVCVFHAHRCDRIGEHCILPSDTDLLEGDFNFDGFSLLFLRAAVEERSTKSGRKERRLQRGGVPFKEAG